MNILQKNKEFKAMKKYFDGLYVYQGKLSTSLNKKIAKNKCFFCPKFQKPTVANKYTRFDCCDCKEAKATRELNHELMTTIDANIAFGQKEYAEKVFEILSKIKPLLENQKTKQSERWEDVFPDSIEELTDYHRSVLYCIGENDGYTYRLYDEK